jgi:hypothetical protein
VPSCTLADSSTKFGAAGLKSAEDTLVAELAVLMTAGIADEARPEAAKAVSKAGGDNARSKHAPASAIPDSGCAYLGQLRVICHDGTSQSVGCCPYTAWQARHVRLCGVSELEPHNKIGIGS